MRKLRFFQRSKHLLERVIRESKAYPARKNQFGSRVANAAFVDGLIPPGKSLAYIKVISEYVDAEMRDLIEKYNKENIDALSTMSGNAKIQVWCCWWQGEAFMPELVNLCYTRLQQVLCTEKAELHLITWENYADYVRFPIHIMRKYEEGKISLTAMSDILRFLLLEKYGGYWVDITVFFTDAVPTQYYSGQIFCQRMVGNVPYSGREACGSNWCGFSVAGPAHNILFRYMNAAFSAWWSEHDALIDYVLIDYLFMSGYRHIPAIRDLINKVPDNNEDIFEMYQVLNQPFNDDLWDWLTKRNVMHKLTYKMDLHKKTEDGQLTVYGYLHQIVEQARDH